MTKIQIEGRALYQWDTDRHVIIVPGRGETVCEVHFASAGQSDALVVPYTSHGALITANIPNILLQSAANIMVYVVAATANGKRTEYSAAFGVAFRPKPSDYVYTETELKNYTALESRISALENGGVARIGNVTILADNWVGEASPYSQVVKVDGVTENSQVDLTPSAEQLAVFYEKDLAFVTENEGGIVTVYAIGQKPENDYTIQVTITEVDYA